MYRGALKDGVYLPLRQPDTVSTRAPLQDLLEVMFLCPLHANCAR